MKQSKKISKLTSYLPTLEKILFFLVIIFLPTQLGKHFWPESSFIYSLRIDYLSPTVYLWDLLVLTLITVFGLVSYKKTGINKNFILVLVAFLLSQSLSIPFSENPIAGLLRMKDYLVVGLFGLYIASVKFSEIKKLFFSGLLVATIFTCFLAISQFLLGRSLGLWILGERDFSVATPLISKFIFYEQVFLRPYATFPHPNLLAAFLILSLPLLIYGLSEKLKSFKLMLGLLIASSVFITFSRPGMILIGIQLALLFKRFWKLMLILAVLTAPIIFVRLSSVFTFDTLAVLRRQELSEYAITLFLQNPFLGVGLNNFINSLASDTVLVGTSRFLQPAHNIFLLTLAETGLIGSLGFLGLIIGGIWINIKNNSAFSQVLLSCLMMIIFLGFFDHYFLTLPQGQRMLFLILGLSFLKNKA